MAKKAFGRRARDAAQRFSEELSWIMRASRLQEKSLTPRDRREYGCSPRMTLLKRGSVKARSPFRGWLPMPPNVPNFGRPQRGQAVHFSCHKLSAFLLCVDHPLARYVHGFVSLAARTSRNPRLCLENMALSRALAPYLRKSSSRYQANWAWSLATFSQRPVIPLTLLLKL